MVDTLQPDPLTAAHFYGKLLGWTFLEPAAPTGEAGDGYLTALLDGRVVSGIGQAPASSPALWRTHVRVADLETTLAHAQDLGATPLPGTTTVGSFGRIATMQDPTGVPFCLWQAGTRGGAEVTGEPGAWAMSSLHTTDADRAHAFYGTLFGWELDAPAGAPFSRWRVADHVVAVMTSTDGVAVPAHWSVNFTVSDADAIAELAPVLGGTVVMAPMDTPGFRSAVIADPHGGFIAISQHVN